MRKIPDRRALVPPQRDQGKPEKEPGDSAGQVVSPGARIRSQRQGGSSFAARFGRVILQNGIAAIPSALYHYQGRLGLSAQQVWFISYVLSHKWDEDLPYPSLKKMAKVTGFSLSQLQRIKNGLCQAGLLHVYPRYDDKNGQGTNAYDFSGLFDVLEKLIESDGPTPNAITAEGEGPDMSELGQVDPSFVARYGRVITRRGVAAVPRAVFTHHAELKLTAQQVWFITYIFSFQWDTALPYPSIRKMSAVTGYSSVQLHNIKTELVEAGYLRLVRRTTFENGQDTNAYDFSGLLDAIRELLQPEKNGAARDGSIDIRDTSGPDLIPAMKRRGRRSQAQIGDSTGLIDGTRNGFAGGNRNRLSVGDSTELAVGGRKEFIGGGSVQFTRGDLAGLPGEDSVQLSDADSIRLIRPGKRENTGRSSSPYQRGVARGLHEKEALTKNPKKREMIQIISLVGRKLRRKPRTNKPYSHHM